MMEIDLLSCKVLWIKPSPVPFSPLQNQTLQRVYHVVPNTCQE